MSERDFVWVLAAVAAGIGLYSILFAGRVAERDKRRSAQAREKYGHRPAILRPKIANQRPSVLRTRLVGLGFLAIAGFAVYSRLA